MRYKTRLNVTKCCHAKRSNTTCETSKSDPFCRTYYRHGHTGLARTVADGCERLRTVADGCGRLRTVASGCGRLGNVERTHPQPAELQSETGTLATHSRKNALNKPAGKCKCMLPNPALRDIDLSAGLPKVGEDKTQCFIINFRLVSANVRVDLSCLGNSKYHIVSSMF